MTRRDLAFLGLLCAAIALSFGPALKHPPRADQWCYLADVRGDHTFVDLVRHSYSYNRTRITGPGDTDLFRPVLFVLLAAEKAAFEGRVAPPQVLGIVLHCAVCAIMFVLMRQARAIVRPDAPADAPDWFTYGAVAFFALNPYSQELAIWAHLHGYLLFLLCVFGSMSCLFKYASGGSAKWLAGAWALALVSAFTYELGQAFAVLAGASAAALAAPRVGTVRAVGIAVAFASVMGGYQVVNRIDAEYHRATYHPDDLKPAILGHAFSRATLSHSARYGTFTTVQPFFPALVQHSYAGQRLEVAEHFWRTRRHIKAPTPVTAVSVAVLAGCAGLGIVGMRHLVRDGSRAALVAFGLPAALYALYAAMTVLGRMNMRPGPHVLSANSYYTYTALAFLLVAASAVWPAAGPRADALRRWLGVGFVLLAAVGSERVWQANVMVAKLDRDWTVPLAAVQELVDKHRGEPDFTFEVDYAESDPTPSMHRMRLPNIVFAEWVRVHGAKYRVVIRDGKATAYPRP